MQLFQLPAHRKDADNTNANLTEFLGGWMKRHSNAQHPAQFPADAQHTPLSPRLGSGDAGELDEGNFPRKHGCGDAQLENKCSQSGIQSPTRTALHLR